MNKSFYFELLLFLFIQFNKRVNIIIHIFNYIYVYAAGLSLVVACYKCESCSRPEGHITFYFLLDRLLVALMKVITTRN
jgi:hypothetical protein